MRQNQEVSHIEALRVVHLNALNGVLGVASYPGGRFQIDLPFRAILADILNLGSRGLILTHNHPLGDPTPSANDVSTTLQLATMLHAINVRVHDHIVIGKTRRISFREAGLL